MILSQLYCLVFFQDLHLQFIEGKKNEAIHNDMDVTYQHLENCFDNYINLNYFADWFDNELKRNFKIDVMGQQIDNTQPFFTFNNNQAKVLLIKCEKLSSLDQEIGHFLDVDNFELKNSNEAKNKWYSNIYQYFKQKYDFSKLFYMYDLPLYQHVYSEQEREAFKTKWQQTPGTKTS